MPKFFIENEESEMKKQPSSKSATNKRELGPKQKQLVELLTPIVKKYYQLEDTPKEEIELAIEHNIEGVQELMGSLLGDVYNQKNEKLSDTLDEADQRPSGPY